MALVYLSLGSNLGDRARQLRAAIGALDRVMAVEVVSSLYETDPWGLVDQPPFLNVACCGRTAFEPLALLHEIKEIEREIGRVEGTRWGPRVVDIDIILYDNRSINSPELTIPHASALQRAFVVLPLAEIAPAVTFPGTSVTLETLSAAMTDADSVRPYFQ